MNATEGPSLESMQKRTNERSQSFSCWILQGPHNLVVEQRLQSLLIPEYVLVRFAYCGVCGSDLSTFEGKREGPFPRSLGHEFVGTIEAIGSNVRELHVGDVVVSDLNFRCGECPQCRSGRSHLCEHNRSSLFTNRAFAEYADIHESYLVALNTKIPAPQHALIEPLSCVLHALDQGAPTAEDRLLVLGAGGLGLCMALALTERRLSNVHFWDPFATRLSALKEAAAAVIGEAKPPYEQYDLIFDLSGSLAGLSMACDHLRPGGRLISMSHLDGYGDTTFLLPKITRKDVWFIVSYLNGARASLSRAAGIIAQYWTKSWDPLLSVHPSNRLPWVMEQRRNLSENKDIIDLTQGW